MAAGLRKQESYALITVSLAWCALDQAHDDDKRRLAEQDLRASIERLDMIQEAIRKALPYKGGFTRCASCRNIFSDEGSYLAHWAYIQGEITCVFLPPLLMALGFIVEEHKIGERSSPDYVLRHPLYVT
ncbi:hypothetical protein P9250_01110 [Caballeronia sp. LP006]|uniref:hypothetical protein n=1 Tax=unclassified Caballeronia TaxID=2646786 RepID=UPI0020284592|nr:MULTISPECIES: hypothetical protein [unclassified Caballeronia]MDR5826446.1 hypothetical protein [Caballeronia sp. LP006]